MLGVIVYQLRTEIGGHFTMFPGKLLHGALFRCFAAYDAALSEDFHGRSIKPFTIGALRPSDAALPPEAQTFNEVSVAAGRKLLLRVTALDAAALMALSQMPCGTKLHVGKLVFSITGVLADGRAQTGAIAPDELITAALSMGDVRRVRFSFRTPTVFRVDGCDYALAQPELIFASFADKWTQLGLPAAITKTAARAAAAKLIPLEWSGAGMRIRISERKSIPAFVGDFSFSLSALAEEEREIILLLAQFAPFCGTGRMTAQGMGETHVHFS